MRSFLTIAIALAAGSAAAEPPPIIDVHVHAMSAAEFGPPPLKICVPDITRPFDPDKGVSWPEESARRTKEPLCDRWFESPMTDEALMRETLAVMERRNIIGVVGGSPELVKRWKEAAPDRVIPALQFNVRSNADITPEVLARMFDSGEFKVLGEVLNQYGGLAPNAPEFEPYWKLAEEKGFPVGIHIGTMPPGSAYLFGHARIALADPLLLEEVLVKHPRLRVYVMHAGYPFGERMLAMLDQYPQLYVDIGVLPVVIPRAQFNAYLTQFVRAGFSDRILFGSDQMIWPGIIEEAIDAVEDAPLTKQQKRDIFYNNAVRFLRLDAPPGEG